MTVLSKFNLPPPLPQILTDYTIETIYQKKYHYSSFSMVSSQTIVRYSINTIHQNHHLANFINFKKR